MKKQKQEKPIAEEWDISEGMGILPADISLTQNVGCVGSKSKKPTTKPSNSENKT
jgi:hypothetical protein